LSTLQGLYKTLLDIVHHLENISWVVALVFITLIDILHHLENISWGVALVFIVNRHTSTLWTLLQQNTYRHYTLFRIFFFFNMGLSEGKSGAKPSLF
jgi:hypothetical protein